MNGVHDMGGMHGMGSIEVEMNEPVFHAKWEGRVFALSFATFGVVFPVDETRSAIERIGQAEYLASSYYERWLSGLELLLAEHGLVQPNEVDARVRELKRRAVA
jgi:hypothetical protein